jgi:uncharacterized membrane protein YdjX (TVP38/TMEM64 family)
MHSEKEKQQREKKRKKARFKSIIILVILMALIIGGAVSGIGKHLARLKEWINDFGVWSPLIFILIYAAATVAAVPGSALTLIAGSIFGSVKGVLVVSIASTLGASLAFLVSRYVMRNSIVEWLSDNKKFQSLDRLTEQHGNIMVAFTRLVPLFPFNLLNYGFGLTKVPLMTYVLWSWMCMLPGTILYVVGGDAISKALEEGKPPWVLIIVLAIVLVIITAIGNHVRKILKEKA